MSKKLKEVCKIFRIKVIKENGNSFYIKDCMLGGPKVYSDYNKASDEVKYQRKLREDTTKFVIEVVGYNGV